MRATIGLRVCFSLCTAAGFAITVLALFAWRPHEENLTRLGLYLTASLGASRMKLRLPGTSGNVSLSFAFILSGLLELQTSSVILIGVLTALTETLIGLRERLQWRQVVFNVLSVPVPILAAAFILRLPFVATAGPVGCEGLFPASALYVLLSTALTAGFLFLSAAVPIVRVSRERVFFTVCQSFVGGVIASAVHLFSIRFPWQAFAVSGIPVYLVYRCHTMYLRRMEQHERHIEELADLHWRTIAALALAIEANDDASAAHLRRVQVYAAAVAREFNLPANELQALHAAALLHDIGKLAVPEYITSKRGRLTAEEFEKMKIHPCIGADILQRVKFPYPVAPIVRSHHEKFDGTGYPDGLRGEAIPIGARILSAVDALDALASHRHYRPAISLSQAMDIVKSESGKSFDPRVVKVLAERYEELESKISGAHAIDDPFTAFAYTGRTSEPVNDGVEARHDDGATGDFTLAIASARREVQHLVEITAELGNSLSLDETLALLAVRLGNMVPHDAIVIYLRQGDKLIPQFVQGESFRLFSSLEIPVGQGLSGWVAENDCPIVNGDPSVETACLSETAKITNLQSAISVPLPGRDSIVGVVTLYHLQPAVFTQDHLRVLLAIRKKAGTTIENAQRFKRVKNASERDELTGLLNAGSLFRLLRREIAAAERDNGNIAVIVLDVDGFKYANDLYGHLAGNRILQRMASGLSLFCRTTDIVARMGGDEFVLVLRNADETLVTAVLSGIRELGPEAGAQACGEGSITISAGVAWYPCDGGDPELLLEAADQRMYQAKPRNPQLRVA